MNTKDIVQTQSQLAIVQAMKDIFEPQNVVVCEVKIAQPSEGHIDIGASHSISSARLPELSKAANNKLQNKCYIKFFAISGIQAENDLVHNSTHPNLQMQRIRFFIAASEKDLESIVHDFEQLNEYDHRTINRDMNLFHLDSHVSPGAIMWLPKGVIIVNKLKEYIRSRMVEHGYQEIITPAFANLRLWQKSGHWDMYKENMVGYNASVDDHQRNHDDEHQYCLKPMSCPLHCEIFKQLQPTYKHLPLKLFEFGLVHRNEPSGALHGLARARLFTQDDSHVFCKKEDIKDSVITFCDILKSIYSACGFDNVSVKLSTRPDKYAGSLETWAMAESMLKEASVASELDFTVLEGDGAFYGPKLEFHLLDRHNRSWQCGTLQLDLVLAERLNVSYINEHNTRETPVMIHHAAVGSIERFVSVLIEHHKGRLPCWLAPVQITLVTVNENVKDYAHNIMSMLSKHGFRAEIDDTNNTLSYKIRKAKRERVPLIGTIGDVESRDNTLSIRNAAGDIISVSNDKIIEYLTKETVLE